ncbi:hypothetical protein [Kitasatospora sp. NBC_00039]|uniref:hypothetical protein n=1 Tax=Kitasatospora sp. NBC_00039 TaxID=2903565 RepID=UPI0032539696
MSKKTAVVAAAVGMVLLPFAGVASAATPLPCGSGYQCDDFDPGKASWDKKDTDDRTSLGCSTVELRSGKNNGSWYGWGRLTVGSVCGRYDAWIDRSYDGGKSWTLVGYFEVTDIEGSNFGNMFYWPDGAKIRAGLKKHGDPFSKCRTTAWH